MQIKELYIEVKKSRNFQTYTAGELLHLTATDNPEEERLKAMTRCRKAVMEQINIDGGRK